MDKDYKEKLANFENTLNVAMKVSKLGAMRKSTGNKMTWTCVLHTRLTVMGTTLNKVAPKKMLSHWDYASMFSLTRNIIECYQTLFYLCVDKISDDESSARKKLFDLHDYYSRKKLFSFTEDKIKDMELEAHLISELSQTKYFQNLSEKQQKLCLKGENAFFISREEIEERMESDKMAFKLIYKLFSSNTHSFPMGFYGMLEGERGTGIGTPIEVGYSALAIDIAEQYIRKSSNDMLELLPDIFSKLSKAEQKQLQ